MWMWRLIGVACLAAAGAGAGPTLTLFVDETEYHMACRKASLVQHRFDFSAANIEEALSTVLQPSDTGLGPQLLFSSTATHLPVHFTLHKTAVDREFSFVRTNTAGQQGGLQLGRSDEGHDFSLVMSARLYHAGTAFRPPFAVGLRFDGMSRFGTESITLYNHHGDLVSAVPPIPAGTHDFLGIVSTEPLGRVQFFEHDAHAHANPVVLQHLYIGLGDAFLLDGVSAEYCAIFWMCFNVFVLVMLAVDLICGRSGRGNLREALCWSLFWVGLALAFNGALFVWAGRGPAITWLTAYLLEKFLSIDNLFVFALLFVSFKTPARFQHRVLTYGIVGAIILRAVFIFTGVLLVQRFTWLLALFALFLIYAGITSLLVEFKGSTENLPVHHVSDSAVDLHSGLQDNPVLQFLSLVLPITATYDHEGSFFVFLQRSDSILKPQTGESRLSLVPARGLRTALRRAAQRVGHCLAIPVAKTIRCLTRDRYAATPLFAVLLVVESTDVMFAVDSIPAVLSLTQIFAVMGLRALYFALAAAMTQFSYLGTALGLILCFIGGKMLAGSFLGIHVGVELTLLVVLATVMLAILLSVCRPRRTVNPDKAAGADHEAPPLGHLVVNVDV